MKRFKWRKKTCNWNNWCMVKTEVNQNIISPQFKWWINPNKWKKVHSVRSKFDEFAIIQAFSITIKKNITILLIPTHFTFHLHLFKLNELKSEILSFDQDGKIKHLKIVRNYQVSFRIRVFLQSFQICLFRGVFFYSLRNFFKK